MRILVVDDEPDLIESVRLGFELQWREIELLESGTGEDALDRIEQDHPDIVLLDIGLPDIDGFEVLRRVRAFSDVPVVMLTARDDAMDKVKGLELGADDYITKPFSMREFRSRVKAALRRSRMAPANREQDPLERGELRIDPEKRLVTLAGRPVQTTFVEFEILETLARSPGRVYSRDTLLAHVWGDSAYRDPRTIDVHIRHLREKIEADAKEPEYIFTVRGVGYRFRDTAEE